jgi:hypothetical protein
MSALLIAGLGAPSMPLAAKGPKPVPVGECQLDISGRMQCAYETRDQCLQALRALRREHYDVQGCWLSTADPTWWHYNRYVLEYYP